MNAAPATDILKASLNSESAPKVLRVETGAILRFLDAFGAPLPDDTHDLIAPATFPTILQTPAPGLGEIDPARVLHGEQEYIYERPLRSGEEIICVSRLAEVSEKSTRLGEVAVAVVETTGRDSLGELVLTERLTLIVR